MSNTHFVGKVIYKDYNEEKTFLRISIAVKNKMKGKDDVIYPCVAFKGVAQMLNKKYNKGDSVIVDQADFTSDRVQQADGSYKYYTNFIINRVDFLDFETSNSQLNEKLQKQKEHNDNIRQEIKDRELQPDPVIEDKSPEPKTETIDDFDDDIPF